MILLVSVFLGLFMALFAVFVIEFLGKANRKLKEQQA
jgi:uncharacterized protein involved in exopolysaccharide biosynthesis